MADFRRRTTNTKRLEPGYRTSMYPCVALRCPTYRENSHANHTWHQHSHQTACLKGSEAPSPWVRFPSPAPIIDPWSSREIQGRSQAVDSKVFHRFGLSSD